jgi:hypothetical protein
MDSEDDTRDGLDELSSLFESRTAPLPAQPRPAGDDAPRTAFEPPTAFGSPTPPVPPAFGRPVPDPTPASPRWVSPPAVSHPAVSSPPVSPPPVSAPPPASDAPFRPPFSPPPLVPVGTAGPAGVSPVAPSPVAPNPVMSSPVESSPVAPSPAPGQPVPAPAFGGAVIAPARGRRAAIPPSGPPTPAAETAPPGASPASGTAFDLPTPDGVRPVAAAPDPTSPPLVAAAAAPTTSTAAPPLDLSGPLLPGDYEEIDEERFARSTPLERVVFALAFLVPPVGLISSIVAAARSSSRRGWVIGLLKAGMAVGLVFSLVTAGFAYAGYNVLQQQQAHDRIAAASAGFCAAMTKDPTLARGDGGWPQPAGSVPQSLTAMQSFVDRWNALAKVSPSGIRSKVATVAATGTEIIKTVTVQRTVDDAENRSLVESAVSSSGVQNWRSEYCD